METKEKKEIEDLIEKINKAVKNKDWEKRDELIQELWETAAAYGSIYDHQNRVGMGNYFDGKEKIWRDRDYSEQQEILNKVYSMEDEGKLERRNLSENWAGEWTIWLPIK